MRNLTYLLLLSGLLSNALAAPSEDIEDARRNWEIGHFKKEGAPVPDGGISIVPAVQLSHYNSIKSERAKAQEDIEKYGYIHAYSADAKQLLEFKTAAAQQFKKHDAPFKPKDTYLRHTIEELSMAYTFIGVPAADITEMLGVSPYLTYLNHQGWVGAVQFFEKEGVGICSFSENNVKLSHGSVILAKEDVRSDINNKTTTVEVAGNQSSGFLYDIEWYDLTFFRHLQCANATYSPDITTQVIALAKRIDAQ